jgi:hypothetical protein
VNVSLLERLLALQICQMLHGRRPHFDLENARAKRRRVQDVKDRLAVVQRAVHAQVTGPRNGRDTDRRHLLSRGLTVVGVDTQDPGCAQVPGLPTRHLEDLEGGTGKGRQAPDLGSDEASRRRRVGGMVRVNARTQKLPLTIALLNDTTHRIQIPKRSCTARAGGIEEHRGDHGFVIGGVGHAAWKWRAQNFPADVDLDDLVGVGVVNEEGVKNRVVGNPRSLIVRPLEGTRKRGDQRQVLPIDEELIQRFSLASSAMSTPCCPSKGTWRSTCPAPVTAVQAPRLSQLPRTATTSY